LPASAPDREDNPSHEKAPATAPFLLLKIPGTRTIVESQLSDNEVMIQFSSQIDHLPARDSRGLSLLSALLLLPLGG
jgi:hypothetical protein